MRNGFIATLLMLACFNPLAYGASTELKWQLEDRGCHLEDRGCHVEDRGCHVEDRGCHVEDRGCHDL